MSELHADYTARGIASEAQQSLRSHEQYDNLRFKNMGDKLDDICEQIKEMKESMDAGFKSYDGKFWSLAIMIIATLLTCTGAMAFFLLTEHH